MTELSEDEIKHQLQQMDPYEFEELVAELWGLQGYETKVRKGSGDRGIDIEATKENPCKQKILIQAKRYGDDNKIGSEEVRKYATLYQQVSDVDIVVIVTTSKFTKEGTSLARDLDIRLVDKSSITNQIEMHADELDTFLHDEEEDTDESSEEYEEKSLSDLIMEEKSLSDLIIEENNNKNR